MQAIQGAIVEEGTELDNLLSANERLVQANEAQKEKRSVSSRTEAMTNQESTNPFSSMSQPTPETPVEERGANLNSSNLLAPESAQVGLDLWDSICPSLLRLLLFCCCCYISSGAVRTRRK